MSKNCCYIAPEEIILGQSYIHKNGKLKGVDNCGYIIPFSKAIEHYLNLPEVRAEITNVHESDNKLMKNYCDGQYIKENGFIQSHAPCLQFTLNTDSLEVVKPIGAHVNNTRLMVFIGH